MMTPAERYKLDPLFAQLVRMFHDEFARCDQSGAGLTPTEVRDAASLAWQMYCERNAHPLLIVRPPE